MERVNYFHWNEWNDKTSNIIWWIESLWLISIYFIISIDKWDLMPNKTDLKVENLWTDLLSSRIRR